MSTPEQPSGSVPDTGQARESVPGYGMTLSEPTIGAYGRPQRGSPQLPGESTAVYAARVEREWRASGDTVQGPGRGRPADTTCPASTKTRR